MMDYLLSLKEEFALRIFLAISHEFLLSLLNIPSKELPNGLILFSGFYRCVFHATDGILH
jgi:hypothetical protein